MINKQKGSLKDKKIKLCKSLLSPPFLFYAISSSIMNFSNKIKGILLNVGTAKISKI